MRFLNNRGRRAVGVTKKYRTDFELKEEELGFAGFSLRFGEKRNISY